MHLCLQSNFKSFLEKQHQIAYMSWSVQFRPQYWGRFHSENANKPQTNNFANLADPKLDKHIESYRNSTDELVRIKEAKAIQEIVHEKATHIPLFEVPYYRVAYWGWIRHPKIPSTKQTDGLDFFSASIGGISWIDKDAKKRITQAKKSKKKLPPVTIVDTTWKVKAAPSVR